MQASKRTVTGLVLMAMTAGAVLLVDVLSDLSPATADPGTSLTEPIPPAPEDQRIGNARNRIGWTHAKKRLQTDMPMGRGIPVGQVEGNAQTGYLADTNHRALPGTGFIPESGEAKLNGHATTVATYIAGPQSAGQGVRAVHAWTVNDWMGEGYLKSGSIEDPRSDHPARVFNHSWIGRTSPGAPVILRRVDHVVDQQDVLVVVGVDNQPGKIPHLLASAYNTISVGAASGNSSDELTEIEGAGRCKPDIVGPGGLTSWTTGQVTGVCAALLEYADRLVEADDKNKDAARSEVMKAVLLASADRSKNWSPQEGEPLDRKFGAGMVDLDRSLVMLDGGYAEPDKPTNQRYGWSFATIDPGTLRSYDFTVDLEQGQTGIALVWHRRVIGGKAQLVNEATGESRDIWNPGSFVPNLNLGLVKRNDDGSETMIAASISKVDNVELIHLPTLEPGKYTLRVVRSMDKAEMPWDYAIAWRIEAKE
ncbi:MAG: S8 family serine peptidase [Phycisphaeraceae bacterium]